MRSVSITSSRFLGINAGPVFGSSEPLPSSLLDLVVRVVLVSPKEQVLGIAAGWIVAGMKNVQTLWDGSSGQLPGEPVCQYFPVLNDDPPIPLLLSMVGPLLTPC